MIDTALLTIQEISTRLRKKEFSVSELADAYLAHIHEKNKNINAYVEIFEDIKEQAARAQKKIDSGEAALLTGIPLAIKDNILIKGRRATSASKILEGYVAPYDATVIQKIKQDAVFLGRANMDEFAMGSSTESSCYGVTKNPLDPRRVPGGSSGGSAAAVAMNGAVAALGSDTGGSIRQPAAFCGLVGLKPTYGAVSRSGLMAMASSLDQIGPITKTVEDSEIIFNAIRGKDPLDSTSREYREYQKKNKKTVIGVPVDFLEKGVDRDVLLNFNESIQRLKDGGYEIKEIKLNNLKYSLAVYYIIMPAEVSSNLARFDGVKYGSLKEGNDVIADYMRTRGEGFGKEARRRILLGTYVLSTGYYDAYYNKAHIVRRLIKQDFEKAFHEVDVIATPTTPSPAFKIGEKTDDPMAMYLADIFTVSANLVGIPAISLPSGTVLRDGVNLPLGFQIMAPHFGEKILFDAGKDFEKSVK